MKPVIGSEEFLPAGNDRPGQSDASDAAFRAALDDFRRETLAAAQRPDGFWNTQHAAIMERTRSRQPVWRIGLSWALATALVLFGFGLFLFRVPAQPIPDYAGGYDQDLLIDVEQALHREIPSALEPALLLSEEIEQNLNKKPTL
jgi:hypothetical protein